MGAKSAWSIVALAPPIEGWEVHWAKPPKQWELQFSLAGDEIGQVAIDAREWRYVLYEYPGKTFDVVIETSGSLGLDDELRHRAAVIVLDGVLGELQRLERIREIEAVPRLGEGQMFQATSIRHLADHIRSMI